MSKNSGFESGKAEFTIIGSFENFVMFIEWWFWFTSHVRLHTLCICSNMHVIQILTSDLNFALTKWYKTQFSVNLSNIQHTTRFLPTKCQNTWKNNKKSQKTPNFTFKLQKCLLIIPSLLWWENSNSLRRVMNFFCIFYKRIIIRHNQHLFEYQLQQ